MAAAGARAAARRDVMGAGGDVAGRWPRLLLCLAAAAILAAGDAAPAGPPGAVLGLRGSALVAALAGDGRGLAAGATILPWDDVAAAGFAGGVSSSIDRGLVTVAGDVLRGVPGSIDRGTLKASSDLFGPLSLPLERFAAVVLSPIGLPDLAAACGGEPGALLANGDRVLGKLSFLNAETAGIDTGRRIAQIPRGRIVALVLAPAKAADARPRTWVLLGSGDRVGVDQIKPGTGGIGIETPLGTAALPLRSLAAVWTAGGRVQPLAQLKPVRLAAADRLGTVLPVRYGAGFPLAAGGVAAADGLLLPARGEAAWAVGGSVSFLCWVAPAPGAGGCVAQVLLDGKPAWEHAFAAGAAPVAVAVKLGSARELVLRSDPGADGETAACAAAFCHPVLIR